ncbi:hypothetical protein PFISCL1PPCAC_10861, partial [Pristionchus fissidentatus]
AEMGVFVTLTPVKQSADHNIVRIARENVLHGDNIIHIAGGPHQGIIVNKLNENIDVGGDADVELSHSVWLHGGGEPKQEKRSMSFRLSSGVGEDEGRAIVNTFFRQLMHDFPKDYVSFMKRVLKLMQEDFKEIDHVDLDMRFVAEEEQVAIPDAVQYDSSSEAEPVTVALVQEVLEHAYPNGLTLEVIAEALRCTEQEATQFLLELETTGIVQRVGDEWIRVDTRNVDAIARGHSLAASSDHPTVAIVSCLFLEKQAVDALLDEPSTIHKYKSGGDSNVYTIGRIGHHKVVATKLALIGDSREATTSAGSITTRLLGNFQHIQHVLVVGVGGGVPHFTDAKRHVRLGDVVVSTRYIYGADLVVDRQTEQFRDFTTRDYKPAEHEIAAMVTSSAADTILTEWEGYTSEAIGRLASTSEVDFTRPPPETDLLALSVGGGNVIVMPHPDPERKTARFHVGPVGGLTSIKKVAVTPIGNGENGETNHEEQEEKTHEQIRERFASQFSLRSIDAGFDSVVAAIVGSRIDSWALVRGISDYQNGQSRASRVWQAHAATRAAAMARTIVERLPKA